MTFLSVRVSRERRRHLQTGVSGTIFFAKRVINRVTLGKHKGQSGIIELPPMLYLNSGISCFSYVCISAQRMPLLQVLAGFKFAFLPFQKMNY